MSLSRNFPIFPDQISRRIGIVHPYKRESFQVYFGQLEKQSMLLRIEYKGEHHMSTEQNKAQVRRLTEEVWNQGNFAVIDELVARDYVGHEPSMLFQGQEGFRQFASVYRSAF